MTGWRTLAATTIRLANEHGARVRQRPAADRLLCETVDEEPTERVRGILDAAYALSGEICEACGAPGDPVRTAAGRQTTRCADCREPADDILARPPWRRERDPEEDQHAPVRGFLLGSNRRALPTTGVGIGDPGPQPSSYRGRCPAVFHELSVRSTSDPTPLAAVFPPFLDI